MNAGASRDWPKVLPVSGSFGSFDQAVLKLSGYFVCHSNAAGQHCSRRPMNGSGECNSYFAFKSWIAGSIPVLLETARS